MRDLTTQLIELEQRMATTKNADEYWQMFEARQALLQAAKRKTAKS